ncbi:nitrile hydratase accessory protein [Acuticoccus kandeliae]|uniref:nitrile hydratase accessory protein n=1 Tax=Acuticoccus kandeliae TaxID=2073160 RepID=UPI000D3E5C72|nr:nitrile hydratase accessory protein [Acuticoccus kandeliae]
MSLADDLATLAKGPDEPAFAAPWEATAFALKAHLVATGALDASAFAALLGEELRKDHAAQDEGTAYFVAYVAALERAIAAIAPPEALAAEQAAWREAAEATPHGEPIVLDRCRDTRTG